MPDVPEVHSLNDTAAAAAANGDFVAAAAQLGRVLELQRNTLGASHPDIATTLNNLALMLEKSGAIPEAGRRYREAYEMAARVLAPEDPLIQVSLENLNAFQEAYGPLSQTPSAAPDVDAAAASESAPAVSAPPAGALQGADTASPAVAVKPPQPQARPPAENRQRSTSARQVPDSGPKAMRVRPIPTAGHAPRRSMWAVIGILVLTAAAVMLWRTAGRPLPRAADRSAPAADAGSRETDAVSGAPRPELPAGSPREASAAPPERPGTGSAPTADPAPAPVAPPVAPSSARNEAAPAAPPAVERAGPSDGSIAVVEASVCRTLSRGSVWRCEPVADPVTADAVYYYTRIASTRDTEVRHQWSRNGRVVRESRLQIGANAATGFRTFTRQTVSGVGAGQWRVALVGPDGRVLAEQRFVVP